MDVVLVRWPAEQERRIALAQRDSPRLLLVSAEADPPVVGDLEDWIRLPAADQDVRARVANLIRVADSKQMGHPVVDSDVLRFAGRTAPLPPVEARLAGALVERFETVVSREALARAGWPLGAPGRNALDVHMMRLRRRLDTLGLVIKTIRSRGYLLEAAV